MKFLSAIALLIISVIVPVFFTTPVNAAGQGQIMFIFDASSSMLYKDDGSTTRFDKAKQALTQALDSIPRDVPVGLRVYGSQVPDTDKAAGCQDSKLFNAPAANNAEAIKTSINSIGAKGWTLMGKTLQDVQSDFSGEGPKTVILISDGIDTCAPPEACEVAKNLTANGLKVKVNTVGLLVNRDARTQLRCIANNSGGDYFDINNIDNLQSTIAALTTREVTLFTTQGIPINGTLRVDSAPLMLPNTSYTDTLTVPQEKYYAFDILPNQKITVNVKGSAAGTVIDPLFSFLRVEPVKGDSGDNLLTGVYANSERFSRGSKIASTSYDFNTNELKNLSDEPTRIAFKVSVSTRNSDGALVPLEIKVTTEGGDAPDNAPVDTQDTQQDAQENSLPLFVLALISTLALIMGFFIVRRLLKSRNR